MEGPMFTDWSNAELALRNAEMIQQLGIERKRLLGNADLFGDPAWDVLVELFIHQCRGQAMPVSSLCASAHIPRSSALKLIQRMCDAGVLERSLDIFDGRRRLVTIAPEIAEGLRDYFAKIVE